MYVKLLSSKSTFPQGRTPHRAASLFFLLAALLALPTAAQTVIDIRLEQYPPLTVAAETVEVDLATNSVVDAADYLMGGDGNIDYLWTNAAGDELSRQSTLIIRQAGNYYLCATDGHHCQASLMVKATGEAATGIIAPTETTQPLSSTLHLLPGLLPNGVAIRQHTDSNGMTHTSKVIIEQ